MSMNFSNWIALALLTLGMPLVVWAEEPTPSITSTSNGALTFTWNYTVTPGTSSTPSSQTVQFKLRAAAGTGYHVMAQASLSNSLSSPASGGDTVGLGDIGIGIVSLDTASSVLTPRTDQITYGFGYDPGTVTATNGLTPYEGAGAGTATLQDLTGWTKVLSGPQIASTETTTDNTNFILVTMRLAVLPQYWTPGTYTAVVSLQILNGQ